MPLTRYVQTVLGYWRAIYDLLRWLREYSIARKSVYGPYREKHHGANGRKLRYSSIVVVLPRRVVLGIPLGIRIIGVCKRGRKEVVREFESLETQLTCRSPITVKYDFIYTWQDGVSLSNIGFIQFRAMENNRYHQAEGWFKVQRRQPLKGSGSEMQVSFSWTRIMPHELQTRVGKNSLDSIADIKRFIEREAN